MGDAHMQVLQEIKAGQQRVEAKLDELLAALSDEADQPAPQRTLEGEDAGRDRDQTKSLDNDGK